MPSLVRRLKLALAIAVWKSMPEWLLFEEYSTQNTLEYEEAAGFSNLHPPVHTVHRGHHPFRDNICGIPR